MLNDGKFIFGIQEWEERELMEISTDKNKRYISIEFIFNGEYQLGLLGKNGDIYDFKDFLLNKEKLYTLLFSNKHIIQNTIDFLKKLNFQFTKKFDFKRGRDIYLVMRRGLTHGRLKNGDNISSWGKNYMIRKYFINISGKR